MHVNLKSEIFLYISLIAVSFHAVADDVSALEYFRQGELHFVKGKYDEAAKWYELAIGIREHDGFVVVNEWDETRFVPRGRGLQKVTETKQKTEDYIPTARLNEIQSWRTVQYRRNHPPNLQLAWIALRDPTKDNILDGGETASIVLSIKNWGKSVALDTYLDINLENETGLKYSPAVKIGNLGTDETEIIEIPIYADHDTVEGHRQISIQAREEEGFDSNVLDIVLQTRPHRPPKLVISEVLISDSNGDSRIGHSELIRVTARIANVGEGVADDVQIKAELGDNVFLGPDSDTEFGRYQLYPGEHQDLEFTFLTNTRFKNGDRIPISLSAWDSTEKNSIYRELDLFSYAPSSTNTIVSIAPKMTPVTFTKPSLSIDVDKDIPLVDVQNEHAVAVVIGNRNYLTPGLPAVEYAINDARILKEYLIKTLGYREHNIIYLEDATAARFNETFGSERHFAGKIYSYVKPGVSDVFIYYSGHGAPGINNQHAYFLPIDVDPNYITTSGYALETFYNNLNQLPARSITVVLDTCFSGNSHGGALLRNISPALIKVNTENLALERTTVFASASSGQVSSWYHQKRHGLFTYYFLKGLSGSGDLNHDGIVKSGELGEYLEREVPQKARRLNGLEQTPSLSQKEDVVIVDFSGGDLIRPVDRAQKNVAKGEI